MHSLKVEFPGSSGDPLAARLELPLGPVRSYAIFAHCFTCSKDLFASRRIASELAMRGIAVLRFDFTGLGASGDRKSTRLNSSQANMSYAVFCLKKKIHH